MTDPDPDAYPLSRFEAGARVIIWHKSDSAHGRAAVVKGGYAVTEGNLLRVYGDSGAAFMTEDEFSVLDVMES